jgi:hypothetical protein
MELKGNAEQIAVIKMLEEKLQVAQTELKEQSPYDDSERKTYNQAVVDCMVDCIRGSIKLFDVQVVG